VAFLRAYRERRPVRDVDLAALPPLVDLHIIFVPWLRLHGVAQAWWDSWWLETDIFDRSLAELRVLDAGHLGA